MRHLHSWGRFFAAPQAVVPYPRVRILVFGAAGPLGREILREALNVKHEVTAFVRDPSRAALDPHKRLRIVQGDALESHAVDEPMIAQEAVIITLGVKPKPRLPFHPPEPTTALSEATDNILRAMTRHNVRRLVLITGLGAGDSKGHGGFVYDRILQPFLLRGVYEDKDRQEALVRKSDRDWVILRPARLTDGPRLGQYATLRESTAVKANTVSRSDVAEFAVRSAKVNRYLYRTMLLSD